MSNNFFYEPTPESELRFGDVLEGVITSYPNFIKCDVNNYSIDICSPQYSVITTPCCSIKKDRAIDGIELSVSPLLAVLPSFFENEYFKKDLTNINRKMNPEQTVSRFIWEEKISKEEKQKRLSEGKTYALIEYFIYENNEKFVEYRIDRKIEDSFNTNYYMINFKYNYKIICKNINNPISLKILQLSISARNEFREKIAHYFGRVPIEDKLDL